MKINCYKLNNGFFLISIAVTFLSSLLISFLYKDIAIFEFCYPISLFICFFLFYRFNNGLIALARGKFAKPSAKNKKFVDYDKVIHNADVLRNDDNYGKKYFVAYKQNTREAYQIIKMSDRLVVHRCNIKDKTLTNLITDFSAEYKKMKSDTVIYYDSIKSVTFSYSKPNFYLPVIRISANNKYFSFIGLLQALDFSDMKDFFADVCIVKNSKSLNAVLSEKEENDRITYKYNLLCLLICIFFPYVIISNRTDNIIPWLSAASMVVCILIMITLLILPLVKSDVYCIGFIEKSYDSRKDLSFAYLILLLSILIATHWQTIINFGWFAVLSAILSVVYGFFYFKKFHINKKESKSQTITRIILIIFVIVFSSCELVMGLNDTVPIAEQDVSYNIIDKYPVYSKSRESYYAVAYVDGEKRDLKISFETYEDGSNIIDFKQTTGLLGITYLSEKI